MILVKFNVYSSFIFQTMVDMNAPLFREALHFEFDQYVKSQVHMQTATELYSRKFSDYAKANRYLGGNDAYKFECEQVLRYYYADLCNMFKVTLLNNAELGDRITVGVNTKRPLGFEKKTVVIADVIKNLELVLAGEETDDVYANGILAAFPFGKLSGLVANNLLALMAIFFYHSQEQVNTCVLEVV